MSAVLNTGALAGKVVFVTGASRGIGSDIKFIALVSIWGVFRFELEFVVRCYAHQGFMNSILYCTLLTVSLCKIEYCLEPDSP